MNLKDIFGTEALTLEQFEKKATAGKAKFVDLSEGAYVGKKKFDAKEAELATANTTMKQLQDAAKKFDGVDVDGLRTQIKDLQTKYDTDIAATRKASAIDVALLAAKAKNSKALKALLNLDEVKLDGDKLLGLDAQLESLKKSDPYMFAEAGKGGAAGSEGAGSTGARVDTGGEHGAGGEATHKLATEEIPDHTHKASSGNRYVTSGNVTGGAYNLALTTGSNIQLDWATGGVSGSCGTPHNNMPPYIAVYVWQRTA